MALGDCASDPVRGRTDVQMPARDWAFQGGAGHAKVVSKCSDPQKMAAWLLQEKGPVGGRGPGCCGGPDGLGGADSGTVLARCRVSGYAVLLGVGNHHLTVLLLTCFFGHQRKCGLGGGHFTLCSLFVRPLLDSQRKPRASESVHQTAFGCCRPQALLKV